MPFPRNREGRVALAHEHTEETVTQMIHPPIDGHARLGDPGAGGRDAQDAPDAALLVRLDATGQDWAHLLPAAPPGVPITVTVSAAGLLVQAAPLVERGYAIAGVAPPVLVPRGRAVADLFVPVAVADEWPGWWAAVTAVADRVLATSHGPVARVFAPVVAVHGDAGAFTLLG